MRVLLVEDYGMIGDAFVGFQTPAGFKCGLLAP